MVVVGGSLASGCTAQGAMAERSHVGALGCQCGDGALHGAGVRGRLHGDRGVPTLREAWGGSRRGTQQNSPLGGPAPGVRWVPTCPAPPHLRPPCVPEHLHRALCLEVSCLPSQVVPRGTLGGSGNRQENMDTGKDRATEGARVMLLESRTD